MSLVYSCMFKQFVCYIKEPSCVTLLPHKVQNNEKLNLLYLVDSIVKNVGGNYIILFERKIVKMFENTFLTTNNEIRIKLHKLRRSWTPEKMPAIFSKTELYRLDVRIRAHDSNWPVEGAPVVTKKPAPAPKPTPAPIVKRPKTPEQVKIEPKPTPVVNPNHPKSDGIQAILKKHQEITGSSMSKKKEREKDKEVTSTTNDKRKTELDARKLKIELEAELEMKTDEGDEIKNQIETLNREKTGKPLDEKKQITSKVVELKKQLLTIDDAKVTIEAKLQELNTAGCRQGDINERLSSLATTKISASDIRPNIAAPPPKKPKKQKGLNQKMAEELKKQLNPKKKKQNRKISDTDASEDSSNDKPKKKKARTTDELTQPKVPIVPDRKIPKKKPIDVSPQKDSKKPYVTPLDQVLGSKKKDEPKKAPAQPVKREKRNESKEDAPDIPDPETSTNRRQRTSGAARGVNDIRGGSTIHRSQDPRALLDKANKNLRARVMTQHDYDVFVGELFKKYPELREATRDPRSRGESKPWYNQTDEYGRYEVERTKLDYRDSLWDPQVDEWDPQVARQRQKHQPPPPPAPTVLSRNDPRLHPDPHPRDIDRRKEFHPAPVVAPAPAPPETTLPLQIEGLDLMKILANVQKTKPATPPASHSTPPPTSQIDSYSNVSSKVFVMDDPAPPPPPAATAPAVIEPATELVPVKLADKEDDFDDSKLPRMEFNEQMCKVRNDQLVKRLYSGMPCTACGLRFLQSQTNRYADHLDFHYRQNRKEKEGSIATNRSWYYSATEWLQYEEIEDVEQRDKSTFDQNKQGTAASQNEEAADKMEEDNEQEKHTVPISMGDNKCAVCLEKFDSFFHQDDEEWHYRDCVVDEKTGKLMHVQCAADADNILEESMISRTESISSIDEPKNEVLKSEAPSESMEVETSIVKSEEQPIIKNEKEEENDLYADLEIEPDNNEMITT